MGMGRKVVIVVFIAVVLGMLPLAAAACGESKVVAQPTFNVVPRLVELGPFSLISGQATHVMIHATKSHPLRIVIFADQKLHSIALYRVARADGGLVTPQVAMRLRGTPHTQSNTTAYGLTTSSVQPGFYRLDLLGPGRVSTLAVMDW